MIDLMILWSIIFMVPAELKTDITAKQDLSYLVKASKEVNPLNIDYYFAVQYHAQNQWEKAMAYYKLYKTVSSANEQEKVGLALKMEQCQIRSIRLLQTDRNRNR